MEMCYDMAFVMPKGYVSMDEEEMMYVEGGEGFSTTVNRNMLGKNYCMAFAAVVQNFCGGLSQVRIAKEVYAHAKVYYAGISNLAWMAACLGGGVTTAILLDILIHASPVNMGGDSFQRLVAFELIWNNI